LKRGVFKITSIDLCGVIFITKLILEYLWVENERDDFAVELDVGTSETQF
jgi:hypothetical protein